MRSSGMAGNPGARPSSKGADRVLEDKPLRECARCGREFKPTLVRRMLCIGCYRYGAALTPFEL